MRTRKGLSVALVVLLALLAVALPATAGGWDDKVTGGGQATAGGTEFSITVSASCDDAGNVSGQMEYSRAGQSIPDLSVHATVGCLGLFDGVAVAGGPAKEQYDPGGQLGEGDWMVVEILEGGVGAGDRVRVRLMSESSALWTCEHPSGSFPGDIYDGNFNIRTK